MQKNGKSERNIAGTAEAMMMEGWSANRELSRNGLVVTEEFGVTDQFSEVDFRLGIKFG
jgi:hypothetical protein